MAQQQINTSRRSLKSQSSDEGESESESSQGSGKEAQVMRSLIVGDAIDQKEFSGFFNMGGKILYQEIVENQQTSTQNNNQVQSDSSSDSDSSQIEEEELKRQEEYELPLLYSKSYLDDEQERVIPYTEIFLPDTKKLREKIRLYTDRVSSKVQEIDDEETRKKRRKLKADYKDLTAGLIQKAQYLPVNPFLEDFFYLKNINKAGIVQKKLAQTQYDAYRTLVPEKDRQGDFRPNKLIAIVPKRAQLKNFSREQRLIIQRSQVNTNTGTQSESDQDVILNSCRVEELRDKFNEPSSLQAKPNPDFSKQFPAPKYSYFEKQIFAFQKSQEEGCQQIDAEQISDQMMQEWMIEQRFDQLQSNGIVVKRAKYWGELKDASSIQQLEKDYQTLRKYEQPKPQVLPIQLDNSQKGKKSVVENLQEFELIKNRDEQYYAPKKSKVTAASIMRLIRFKMGELSEEKYYEQELKEFGESFSAVKFSQKNKDEALADFDENLDLHFNQKKSQIQQEHYRKKEAKEKASNTQNPKQPGTNAYVPVNLPDNIKALKKPDETVEQGENNKNEVNSVTYSSSSSENEEAIPNAGQAPVPGQVTQTMGEELNHAKCIEGHSYYKLDWSNKDLEHFHRPNVQSCFLMDPNYKISILVKNQRNQAIEDRLNPHEYFKEKDKLSLKKGKYCLFEHVDQHPLFVNNFGMASRLKRYYYGDKPPSEKVFKFSYQNKETQHMGPHGQLEIKGAPRLIDSTKPELGLEIRQHLNLLGQVNTQAFKGITVLENKMYNAPVFFQRQNENDFFCTITKSADGKDQRIVVREIESNLYAVGQIEPKLEVYNPQSRDFQNFIKKRCKAYIIRLLEENGRDSVMFSDIQRLFPQIRDQILKNGMKETDIEIDRNGFCNFNQNKYQPERFKDRMTPEMICQFESACHGQYRLQKLGITEILGADKVSYSTNKFNREETDMTLRKIAKLIEKEVLSTPWNLSQSYIKVKQTQEMMMLNGDGDPSFGNGGYSFIKMPLKISADSLQGAKDNRRNLNPAIKNPKAVTRTDGDLRKLQKDVIFEKLRSSDRYGEEFLRNQSRWQMVALLRSQANENSEDQKFQRGVRYTSDKQRQQYNINTNNTFKKQMDTLSQLNYNGYLASEDEPDLTEQGVEQPFKQNQRKNATDYTEEIKQNEKDSISKLSVECSAEDIAEIQKIEDIPQFENLLLIKLDRIPPRQDREAPGIAFSGSTPASLKAEELESLPDNVLNTCKKQLIERLQKNEISKRCEILCLKIRSLNQSIDGTETKFTKVVFHSSEKFIKKFNRYRNKNISSVSHIRKPRNQNQRASLGLTAEQIRQNQEVKSGGESTTSKPIVQKQQNIFGTGVSIASGSFPGLTKQTKRRAKPKVQAAESQVIVKVNFTASPQQSVPEKVQQDSTRIQLVVEDPENMVVELSEEENLPSDSDDFLNNEEEKSEEYIQPQKFSYSLQKQTKQPKLKKQSNSISRFKNVGVSRDDFTYENPTANIGSSRKRQQQSDQALNEIFKGIVVELMTQDTNRYFHSRVTNRDAPGYSTVITRPICLKDILSKTKQSAYKKSSEFLADLDLMYQNSVKYNTEENPISQIAKSLLEQAKASLKKNEGEIVNLEGILENFVM